MEVGKIFSRDNPNQTGNVCAAIGVGLCGALSAALLIVKRRYPLQFSSPWVQRSAYLLPPAALACAGLRAALLYRSGVVSDPPPAEISPEGRAIQEKLHLMELDIELVSTPESYRSAIDEVLTFQSRFRETRRLKIGDDPEQWHNKEVLEIWRKEMELAQCVVDLLFESFKIRQLTTEEQIGCEIFKFDGVALKIDGVGIRAVLSFCETYNEARSVFVYHEEEGGSPGINTPAPPLFKQNIESYYSPFYSEAPLPDELDEALGSEPPNRVRFDARASYNTFCGRMQPYLAAALTANNLQINKTSKWLVPDTHHSGAVSYLPLTVNQFRKAV